MRRVGVSATAVLVAWLVAAAPAAARTGPVTSVVGGSPASISSFPFMARVVVREAGVEGTCSGTVVSSNMVLTAAHCLLNESRSAFRNPVNYEVLTGTPSLGIPGVVSHAERLSIDPGYQPSGRFGGWHDVGLIELTAPVTAPPVALATSQIWGPGTLGYTVGWGLTEPDGLPPGEMQVGETVVQSQSYCEHEVGLNFHPLAELCSIDYPTYQSATCNGDSGGPMLMVSGGQLVEIGITSFGIEEECPTDSPRVDVRADVEANWVASEIAAHPPKVVAPPPTTTTTTTAAPKTTTSAPAPAPALPTLTVGEARSDFLDALRTGRGLATHFRGHVGFRYSCRSTGTTTAQCTTSWTVGALRYWGIVQVSEEWEGTTPVWRYHYWIHREDTFCQAHSRHPGRCSRPLFHA